MKQTTLNLSGPAKDRFIERFFADEPELAPEAARRLARRSKATFMSLRVRKAALAGRRRTKLPAKSTGDVPVPAAPSDVDVGLASAEPAVAAAALDFDPYAFGLVPVYQREGQEGLLARLGTIDRLDHLRQMAKAQQIVLPQELRTGDAALDPVRAAIAEAVARRIADRRAAAG